LNSYEKYKTVPVKMRVLPSSPAHARLGVPVAGVPKTTIRTFTVEGEEKNEGLRPHIPWTKTPDFVHVYRGISPTNRLFFHTFAACTRIPHLSQKNLSKGLINTNICNRSLFFAPKLREPRLRPRPNKRNR